MTVYKAIAEVAGELAKQGISKSNRNQQQGYSFRGIDDVYNALAPLLHKHGLVILPRFVERTVTERQTKNGGALFYSVVKGEFDFVAVEDGSHHTITTFGEAMDSADKSTNKAMSAAYKYAAFQAFSIPTEGDNDADATTHQVAPRTLEPATKPQIQKISILAGELGCADREAKLARINKWLASKGATPVTSSKELTKDDASALIEAMEQARKAA